MGRQLFLAALAILFLSGQTCTSPSAPTASNGPGVVDDAIASSPTKGNTTTTSDNTGPQPVSDELVLAVGSPAVTVIEYADFQCGACNRFANETFPSIRAKYIDTGKVRWIYRHFPIYAKHPDAEKAAEAAQCANQQGSFWEYQELLFKDTKALGVDQLKTYATQLSLDRAAFDACLDGGGEAAKVTSDYNTGLQAGVKGTPSFVMNNQLAASGAQTVDQMSALLDSALNASQ